MIFLRLLQPLAVVLAAALPQGAVSQRSLHPDTMAVCLSPPLDHAEAARMKRQAGFDLLLEGLAATCPDVAFLFADFVVGEVDHAAHEPTRRRPADFLHHIGLERLLKAALPSAGY